MVRVKRCSERRGEDGRFLPAREAYEAGCRCAVCRALHEEYNPADNAERDEDTGQFASTELTRSVRNAVAEAGGDEALYRMVEGGLSANEILSALGLERSERGTGVIYRLLNRDTERYKEAKRVSADAHAERAGEIYLTYGKKPDESLTAAQAKYMNDRAGWHKWMSEIRSGRTEAGVQVNVDIGSLYLEALREKGSMNHNPDRPPVEVQEAEYEFEDEPEGVEA